MKPVTSSKGDLETTETGWLTSGDDFDFENEQFNSKVTSSAKSGGSRGAPGVEGVEGPEVFCKV